MSKRNSPTSKQDFAEDAKPDIKSRTYSGLWRRHANTQKDVYVCCIDYSKAFDCVNHDKLWKCLKQMGIPEQFQELIRSLYANEEATVRTAFGNTNWFEIAKGIRQGCILSSALFNLYAETTMTRYNLDESQIGGRNINNLRMPPTRSCLRKVNRTWNIWSERSKKKASRWSCTSTPRRQREMTTEGRGTVHIIIDNERIEPVQDFLFLGSKIDGSGELEPEIKRRIALGPSAMQGMPKIWKSKDISTATKI